MMPYDMFKAVFNFIKKYFVAITYHSFIKTTKFGHAA